MMQQHIGRIGIILGLALSIAGCSRSAGPVPQVAAGKADCYWSKPNAGSASSLVCGLASMTVVIDTIGVPERH